MNTIAKTDYTKYWTFYTNLDHKNRIIVEFKNEPGGWGCIPPQTFETVADAEDFGRTVIEYLKREGAFPNFCQSLTDVKIMIQEVAKNEDV